MPLGAGLTFLSLFGGAGFRPDGSPLLDAGRIDVMAHLLGLAAGLVMGGLFFSLGARYGMPARAQLAFGSIAAVLVALAWGLAVM